jgi:hypothetical protein
MLHAVDESVAANTDTCGAPDALAAWVSEMTARGILLDGARLHPVSDATTVTAREGRSVVLDGPFAETKEQVAGYDVIECADRDEAVAVAAAHPTTYAGGIEVRAFAPGMPDPEIPDTVAAGKRRYLMLVCADMRRAMAAAREQEAAGTGPAQDAVDEDEDEGGDEVDAWVDSVAGTRIYGWPLEFPDQAVTVRRIDGKVVTTDGPFAETKEQIAGYDLLECDDLDQAIHAAETHPVAAGGVLEVRPLRV